MSLKSTIVCYVVQPDDQIFQVEVPGKATGRTCLNKICRRLFLVGEEDYFGLQFMGAKSEMIWVNLNNRLKAQLHGHAPYKLYLRVKYFVPVSQLVQDETKYQFYLNIQYHLFSETWHGHLSTALQAQLIGHMAQARFGNRYHDTSASEYAVLWQYNDAKAEDTKQELQPVSPDVLELVGGYHEDLRDLTAPQVYIKFMELVAESLELYGCHMYAVTDCFNNALFFGVGPSGLWVCDRTKNVVNRYTYDTIRKISESDRIFFCTVSTETREMAFRLVSQRAATALYRCVTETHCFFCCDSVRPDIVSQMSRGVKGALTSLVYDPDKSRGKEFVYDIRHTSIEVSDSARRRSTEMTSHARASPEMIMPPRNRTDSMASAASTSSPKSVSPSDSDLDMMKDQLARIVDACLCQVCMERELSRAFIPCGHVVCCALCASQMKECPLCRQAVEKRQPVYLPMTAALQPRRVSDGSESSGTGSNGQGNCQSYRPVFTQEDSFSDTNES